MSDKQEHRSVRRRPFLRNSAIVGTGLLAGGSLTGTTAGLSEAQDKTEQEENEGFEAYFSVQTFMRLFGEFFEDVENDCVENRDGWGRTFYIRQFAKPSPREEGVFMELPRTCEEQVDEQLYLGYLITAEEETRCQGGPSGDGPFRENCCSWLFVDVEDIEEKLERISETESVDAETVSTLFDGPHTVTEVHGPEPLEPCHSDAQPVDFDDQPVGNPFNVLRVTFASVTEDMVDDDTESTRL